MIRVAITGIGIVSPLGRGKSATLDSLRHARSGVRLLESIDTTALTCRIGGEVAEAEGAKGHDRFTRFALIAAEEAAEQAGVAELLSSWVAGRSTQQPSNPATQQPAGQARVPGLPGSQVPESPTEEPGNPATRQPAGQARVPGLPGSQVPESPTQEPGNPATWEPDRLGAIIGTGLGGCETLDSSYRRIYRDNARVPPTAIAWSMYNAATSAVSARFGAKGVSYAVVSACASSAHAIGLAALAIRSGQADAMFAGGADAPLTFGIIKAWESMRVLAVDNEHPAAACRPFSADRKGLVLAEGAAVFFLESFESAQKRGAAILGEVAGFGATSDAGHLTDPSADGAARAMLLALQDARIAPEAVGYINAHGTATRANDATESKAIRSVFARPVPVSSTKSMHGHAMGASGAIETAASLLALNEGFLPPTINLETPDPECALDHVANAPREARAGVFLSNSFGFGGMNAVLAIRTALASDLLIPG